MADDQDIKIAVLSEQIKNLQTNNSEQINGLREQQKAHATDTSTKLDMIIANQTITSTWIQQNMNIPAEHRELWNYHQNQKGFLKASSLFWGMIGSGFVAALGWLTGYVHK